MSRADKVPEAPVKKEETKAPEAPAKAEKAPAKAEKAPAKAEKAPAKSGKAAKADKAPAEDLKAPADRKALDALFKKHGAEETMKALSKVKVVDLRALAREYNGEFGIAGRDITLANKKALIEEFRKYFEK